MPDVQELFRLATQKVRPDPDALERQYREQRRRTVRQKAAAFGVAAALAVAAAVLAIQTYHSGGRAVPADRNSPRPLLTVPGDAYGLSADGRGLLAALGSTARMYDPLTGRLLLSQTYGHGFDAGLDAFSSDGKLFATAESAAGGDTRVYDTATGRLLWRFSLPKSTICCFAVFSPDDRFLASTGGGPDGVRTFLFDLQTGQLVNTFSPWGGLAFSPDGDRILISGHAGKVEEGVVGYVVNAHQPGGGHVLALAGQYGSGDTGPPAWSPDGSMLATATGTGKVFVWNARTGERRFEIVPPAGKLMSVAFSPSSSQLATGTTVGTVVVWHLGADGATPILTLRTLDPATPIISLTDEWVNRVSFSPDGTRLITSSIGFSKVWSISR